MASKIIRPNAEISNNGFFVEGAPTTWEAVDDEVEQPEAPNETDMITSSVKPTNITFGLTNPSGVLEVTDFTIYISAAVVNGGITKIRPTLIIGEGSYALGEFTLDNTFKWYSDSLDFLNLTQEQINMAKLKIERTTDEIDTIGICAAYIKIIYTPAETDVPLAKIKKPMSGYNYFIKQYVARKNAEETPYRTPDGTLYS